MGLNARGKLAALLIALVLMSLTPSVLWFSPVLLLAGSAPGRRMFVRALLVLPFSALLVAPVLWSGDTSKAILMLSKSYVSILAVVLFNAVTPAPEWIATLRAWGAPAVFVDVLQFVHRYLTVIAGEAQRMRLAARARGGLRFGAAAGAIGVLFSRSWHRGERIHRAMLARGYDGRL